MMGWLKCKYILLTIVVLFTLLMTISIYTSIGLRAVTYIIKKTVPGIHISKIEGTLYDFKMEGFSLSRPGVEVRIDKTALTLSGLCLLRGTVCVHSLAVDNVIVNIDTDVLPSSQIEEEKKGKAFFLKTPVTVELKNMQLNQANVRIDDMKFGLGKLNGKATWIDDRIFIYPSSATDVKAIFTDKKEHSRKKTIPPTSIQQQLNDILSDPLINGLPNVHIPIKISILGLTGSNWLLHLGGDHYFDNLMIKGSVEGSNITVNDITTDVKSFNQNIHASLTGKMKLANRWPVNAQLHAEVSMNDQLKTTMLNKVSGHLLGDFKIGMRVSGCNDLHLEGRVNTVKKYSPLTLQLKGQHIQWPLHGTPQYQLNDFQLLTSGSINQLTLSGQGQMSGLNLPKTMITFYGENQLHHFNLKQLQLAFDRGKMDIKAKVDWSTNINWSVETRLDQVNFVSRFSEWPIDLNGYMLFSGMIDDNRWSTTINRVDISGHVRDLPLNIKGMLMINSDIQLNANNFKFQWGDNKFLLNGDMRNDQFHAQFNLVELRLFSDEIDGQANGFVTASGSLMKPTFDTDITFKNLAIKQMAVEQMHLQGKVHHNDQLSGNLRVDATSFFYGNIAQLAKISLLISGSEQHHNIQLTMNHPSFSSRFTLDGSLDNETRLWRGRLTDSILQANNKNWQLNHPVAFSYNFARRDINIQQHCWANLDSKFCLIKDVIITDGGNVNLELTDVDLSIFDLFLGDMTQLAGSFSGKVDISWHQGESFPYINANLASNQASVRQRIGTQKLMLSFDVFNLNMQLNEQHAKLSWRFKLDKSGDLSGVIEVKDPKGDKTLTGQILVNNFSFVNFTSLLKSGDYAKGILNTSVTLGGSLNQPTLNGQLTLDQSELKARQFPVDVKSLQLALHFYGQTSKLFSNITTETGVIAINGDADWHTVDDWRAQVTVKGNGMTINNIPPIGSMTVVPDIHLSADKSTLTLNGKVSIPKAQIKVESLSNDVVTLSPDEVMLTSDLKEIEDKGLPLHINSNLLVVIEDDVKIDAFGLDANIKGQLLVKQNKQGLGLNGQIVIPRGRFHAYGQDLVVKKGELLFSGPVNMPLLNIEAIRNPDAIDNNVTAGIRVTGTVDNPEVKLFSNPTMSEQEILSYILRGKGIENSDQSENNIITAILIGLGTAQSGKYIGNVGQLFGIQDLSLDTQGIGDDSQVVVSGYILPNLQLRYGMGIFDSLASFTLRYRLMPKLYLDIVSALAQSVDLLYQFEI